MSVDETKPADTDFVSDWPGYIRLIAALANDNEAAIAGVYAPDVNNKTADATITEFNEVYTVNSASAVTLTLDEIVAGDVGTFLEIHKLGTGNVTIQAGGSDAIGDSAGGAAIVNSQSGEAKAASITLRCQALGQWLVVGMVGTWQIV